MAGVEEGGRGENVVVMPQRVMIIIMITLAVVAVMVGIEVQAHRWQRCIPHRTIMATAGCPTITTTTNNIAKSQWERVENHVGAVQETKTWQVTARKTVARAG